MELSCRFLLCLLLSCALHGQTFDSRPLSQPIWDPPNVFEEFPAGAKATAPKDIIKSLRVDGQRIVLETTKLVAIQKTVGGVIGNRGDAGESLSWLCVHASDSHGTWVLWLLSSEIDDGSVGGFRLQLVKNTTSFDSRCSALSAEEGIVKLPTPVRLGMSKEEIIHTLGSPSFNTGNTLFYLHEHDLTLHNEPYTDMNTLTIMLRGNRVAAMEVWKSTTS